MKWSSLVAVLTLVACNKNSQAPEGEPLVTRPLAGEAPASGPTETGPRGGGPSGTSGRPAPTPVPGPSGTAGRAAPTPTYLARCAGCHGPSGRGDGPLSGAFPVRPRSFADAAWQASVTDAQIVDIIVRGSAALGKSPSMPPSADLAGAPAAELVQVIRGFAPAQSPSP